MGKRLLGKRLRREELFDEETPTTAEAVNLEAFTVEEGAWNFSLTGTSPEERISSLQKLSLSLKERKEEFQEKSCLIRQELILERRVFNTKVEMMKAEMEEKGARLRNLEREWEKVERDLKRRADAADREMLSQLMIREDVERELIHARESKSREGQDREEERTLKRQKNEANKQTACHEMKIEVEECVGSEGDDIDQMNLSEMTLLSVDISRGDSSMGSETGDAIEKRRD